MIFVGKDKKSSGGQLKNSRAYYRFVADFFSDFWGKGDTFSQLINEDADNVRKRHSSESDNSAAFRSIDYARIGMPEVQFPRDNENFYAGKFLPIYWKEVSLVGIHMVWKIQRKGKTFQE